MFICWKGFAKRVLVKTTLQNSSEYTVWQRFKWSQHSLFGNLQCVFYFPFKFKDRQRELTKNIIRDTHFWLQMEICTQAVFVKGCCSRYQNRKYLRLDTRTLANWWDLGWAKVNVSRMQCFLKHLEKLHQFYFIIYK